ncbi:MAG: DUF5522 domain-containing protein [Bacteriovorax sp.]|nr:DUF5522 domain-containing protein [Bacteriovorax sp.]
MNKSNNTLLVDSYINSDGNLVFTEKYHLKRGYCCQSGCIHCPYGYSKKVDPNIPPEFNDAWGVDDSSNPSTDFDEDFDEDDDED